MALECEMDLDGSDGTEAPENERAVPLEYRQSL